MIRRLAFLAPLALASCEMAPLPIPFVGPSTPTGICSGAGVVVDIDFAAAGRHRF